MIENILKNEEFATLMKMHVYECLEYLLRKDITFSILANINYTKFEPNLPEDINKNLSAPVVLFTLGGYTLDSANLSQKHINFEAGFGNENFASLVTIPLGAVIQILIEESPILINFAVYEEKSNEMKTQKSKHIFMSNPKNRDFFNKQ
ncbi:hypothetical protein [Campylobacter hyointestinalis]|uniref:Stringent starvation protein B n=1 Tax=Campylobacter hyointestinalis subsp. lawsonii TaxID=91353 RepID=A0AAV6EFC7_CAMHY|nr:hypothetical protein [Campylobacter hyointestinalis]KAB0612127.1 hypothetical protein F7P66_07250 [Campylobacter hyointestinalis subsp. lawsonii]QKF69388.1 hypothetical protein CHLWT_0815 [Campylobacter hyointestinalis subsp. lawsonii]RAZ28300.1 hypothetical protein CHLT_04810 [Campylobacter hyointestinalis subsp. lawsonii]